MPGLKAQLEQVTLRILEETAFLFPVPADEQMPMGMDMDMDMSMDMPAADGAAADRALDLPADDAGPGPEADAGGGWLGVSVVFRGGLTGRLELWTEEAVATEICANMLGVMDGVEPPPSARIDSVKEVLNILCGNLVTEIGGREHVVALEAPEALPAPRPDFDPATENTDERTVVAAFDIDGRRLWLRLELGERARAA